MGAYGARTSNKVLIRRHLQVCCRGLEGPAKTSLGDSEYMDDFVLTEMCRSLSTHLDFKVLIVHSESRHEKPLSIALDSYSIAFLPQARQSTKAVNNFVVVIRQTCLSRYRTKSAYSLGRGRMRRFLFIASSQLQLFALRRREMARLPGLILITDELPDDFLTKVKLIDPNRPSRSTLSRRFRRLSSGQH
ncbi:hypothetical protein EVAR_36419_1 [Eumeta japonica]|uniref:Uncharacterized protein n=1 Tax=Eumeta variegata TaxID=151549 RepID=A0A4C1VPU6_EUMVA|nr:hypothetical protein EVAR_36419_1 [Eumeta japonica]